MAITSIQTDQVRGPRMIRITSDDSLSTVKGSSYLADQLSNIEDLNEGPFEWQDGDVVLVNYSGGYGLFSYDESNDQLSVISLADALSVDDVSHVVKFAADYTTSGGSATETISISGVEASDLALVVLQSQGSTPRTIVGYETKSDALDVTFDGDPSSDHVITYQIIRAV